MKIKGIIFFVLTCVLSCSVINAQVNQTPTKDFATSPAKFDANTKTRILFIFDDSYSMYGAWNSGNKIDISKKLLGEFLDTMKSYQNLEIALRCYGHQTIFKEHDCKDSKLEVPFGPTSTNVQKVKSRMMALTPTGTTPIAYSLEQCAKDFPPCDNCKNIVVLITDGIEECSGDPCAVSAALQKNNVFLRPFIIGVGLDVKFADVFGCMGKFYDVSNETNFKQVLKVVLTEAVSQTTVQVNLNDINKRPTETNVDMTFYDMNSGKIKYNYVHTINHRGNPDTIIIDPDLKYRMVVHTIPPIEKTNITIEKGKHNIIPIDAPQGYLTVQINGTQLPKSVSYVVRKAGDMNTLIAMDAGKTEKLLVGKYDLEILTLPRIIVKDVEIKQSATKIVKIPPDGSATMLKVGAGYGSVYMMEGKKQTWVCNLNEFANSETLYLQPGNYFVEYRLKADVEAENTIKKSFKIESSKNIQVKFY